MDRTREFLKLAGEAAVALPPPPSPSPASSSSVHPSSSSVHPSSSSALRNERTQQAKYFNQKAAEVSKGISNCSVLLARLTVLARAQSLFKDTDESTLLQVKVNSEMKTLKTRLAELQNWLKQNDLGAGRDAKQHSEQVVRVMEFKLQDSGKQFQQVLETRKQALKQQSQRKRMFGGESDPFDDVDIGVPQPTLMATSSAAATTAMEQEANRNHDGDDPESMMLTSESMQFLPQRQLIPDAQYLRSRVDAITTVESHIAELGQVMSTLATMVSEQDHMVERFGDNVDGIQMDLRGGFLQLEKYYDSIRGNKRLVSRMFGVLVLFLMFFLFFLA